MRVIHGAAEAGDLRYLITIKGIHGTAEAGDLRYLFAKSRWAKGSASFRPSRDDGTRVRRRAGTYGRRALCRRGGRRE